MEKMINLRDLLMHEVQDLYSAEEQIIDALPAMIDKANNKSLKKALQDHLRVTEKQKERLDQVKKLLGEEEEGEEKKGEEKKGLFSRLFGGGSHKCKGTEGLIEEGKKIMGENMTSEVRDAAIIAAAQKIEHYEICGYGTARAFARELNLGEVAELLEETLNEEYAADDLLTDLAVGRLNEEAEKGRSNGRSNGKENGVASKSSSRSTARPSKGSSSKGATSKTATSKTAASKSAASKSSSGGRTAGKSGGGSGVRGKKSAAPSRSKPSGGKGKAKRG